MQKWDSQSIEKIEDNQAISFQLNYRNDLNAEDSVQHLAVSRD